MTFGTPDLLVSGGHFNHPCCGATGRLQFQQYRKYIFALPSSAWEPSGQSAAPTGPFRSCTCRWARVPPDWGAYHRIICTHTVSLLYIRDIWLSRSWNYYSARPAFLAQNEPVAVCLRISAQFRVNITWRSTQVIMLQHQIRFLAIISRLRPDMLASFPIGGYVIG